MMCVSSTIAAQVSGKADRATQIQWSRQFAQIGDLSDAFIASQTMWTDGFYVYVLHSTEGKNVPRTCQHATAAGETTANHRVG